MNKNAIYAIIVGIIIVIAAVGVYFVLKDDSKANNVTFLVQDGDGVYFWMDGNGETADKAVINAAERSGVEIDYTYSEEGSMFLSEIGGLSGSSEAPWIWWMLYTYKDDKWTYSENEGLSAIKSADYDYLGLFYGNGTYDLESLPDVKDSKAWDKSETGTVFTIVSPAGMYFKMNGSGETVFDAFDSMCSTYKLPFEPSDSPTYGKGINSFYGLEMKQVGDDWVYWVQGVIKDGAWAMAPTSMSSLTSADHPHFLVYYGMFEQIPDVPTS